MGLRTMIAVVTLVASLMSAPHKAQAHPGLLAPFGMSFAYGLGEGLGAEVGRGIGDLLSPRSYGYQNAGYQPQVAQAYYGAPYGYGGTQSAYAAPDCSRPATAYAAPATTYPTVQYAAPVYSAPAYAAPVYSAAPVYAAPAYAAAPVYAAPYAGGYGDPYAGGGLGFGFNPSFNFGFGRGFGFGGGCGPGGCRSFRGGFRGRR